MFEKNKMNELYNRTDFTFEEQLYDKFLEIRKIVSTLENKKHCVKDDYMDNDSYKQGFLAGVKLMSSLFIDL